MMPMTVSSSTSENPRRREKQGARRIRY
jgi:hypothetical protein